MFGVELCLNSYLKMLSHCLSRHFNSRAKVLVDPFNIELSLVSFHISMEGLTCICNDNIKSASFALYLFNGSFVSCLITRNQFHYMELLWIFFDKCMKLVCLGRIASPSKYESVFALQVCLNKPKTCSSLSMIQVLDNEGQMLKHYRFLCWHQKSSIRSLAY
jgi:hypothetical protein